MAGRTRLALGLRATAALVIALAVGLLALSQASAQDEVASIGSATVSVGEQASVDLEALNIDAPGLGAWEIGIVYDPAVVSAISCSPAAGSICNVDFASNRVQVAGASAGGLQGDTTLATITFRCDVEGSSSLSLILDEFADATVGRPQPIVPNIQNGRITCTEVPGEGPRPTPRATEEEEPTPTETPTPIVVSLPSTGSSSSGGSALGWLIAAFSGIGLAAMASATALRLRERRA